MKDECEIVEINGVNYVREDSIKLSNQSDKYCIIRTYSAGVFAGEIVTRNGDEVELTNARRIWYWDGAASLSQMAKNGVSKPQNCKFSVALKKHIIRGVIEIIPCTDAAIKSIAEVKEWKE
ncbi:hypothetical protein KAR91_63750 [Candidatus Pacearchaeota archaeon]|nr:hypothetical protein [Candidatus Pacearchaeota archaeon]